MVQNSRSDAESLASKSRSNVDKNSVESATKYDKGSNTKNDSINGGVGKPNLIELAIKKHAQYKDNITNSSIGSASKHNNCSITKNDAINGGVRKPNSMELAIEKCAPPKANIAKGAAKVRSGRTAWDDAIKNNMTVLHGWVQLHPLGKSFHCYLCDSMAKAWPFYSRACYLSPTGHRESDKHQSKLQARLWNIKREEQRIANGKQLKTTLSTKKPSKQSTMIGFFKVKPKAASTTATSEATTATSAASGTIESLPTALIIKGCTGIIPMKLCESARLELNLTIVHAYSRLDPKSDYNLKEVGEGTLICNIYHNECTKEGIHLRGKKQGGNRCEQCANYWTKRSSKIKMSMKNRIANLKRAELLLLVPNLTPDDARSMSDFLRTGGQVLNTHGQRLKEIVRARLKCECVLIVPVSNVTLAHFTNTALLIVYQIAIQIPA